jgi:hypothetical protein
MNFRTSNLADAETATAKMNLNSVGAEQRSELLTQQPATLFAPDLREIKQVELYMKYRPLIPQMYRDELCPKPSDQVIENISKQKSQKGKKKRDDKKAAEAVAVAATKT